jgi:hypothetical protein
MSALTNQIPLASQAQRVNGIQLQNPPSSYMGAPSRGCAVAGVNP